MQFLIFINSNKKIKLSEIALLPPPYTVIRFVFFVNITPKFDNRNTNDTILSLVIKFC